MPESLEILIVLWCWHVVIGAVFTFPVAAVGVEVDLVRWLRSDLLAFILPYGIWLALMAASGRGKTLPTWPSNLSS